MQGLDRAWRVTVRRWRGQAVAVAMIAAVLGTSPSPGVADPQKAAMGALELARHHYSRKEYKEAARLFHRAYSIDPLPEFLFNAARAEQRAFLVDQAEADFRRFLGLSGATDDGRKRARIHLAEVLEVKAQFARMRAAKANAGARATGLPEAPTPTSDPGPAGQVQADGGPSWRQIATWSATGLGSAALLAGGLMFGLAAADQGDLDGLLEKRNEAGDRDGISYDDYKRRQGEIDGRNTLGWSLVAPGAALLGVGVWMWLHPDDTSAALRVGPGSMGVAWRF